MSDFWGEIIDDLMEQCHKTAKEHGFHDHYNGVDDHGVVPEKIALCHTELSEVISADRNANLPDQERNFEILHELADTVIRVLDLAAVVQQRPSYSGSEKYRYLTFGEIMVDKMRVNDERPRLHNKRY